jgi:DNA-directed RNA polymerase subunit RPC12/RpoP
LRMHHQPSKETATVDPLQYYLLEEFIFPEEGGVTGTRRVDCPYCQTTYELEVDVGNTADRYNCENCRRTFEVDWKAGQVRYNPE